MILSSKAFKAYDIRGVYPDYINEQGFFTLGQALYKYLQENFFLNSAEDKILITCDTREHSISLQEALFNGLISNHIIQHNQIILLKEVSTPMSIFALMNDEKNNIVAAMIVTASHNPWEDNGLKLYMKNNAIFSKKLSSKKVCLPICGAELLKIYSLQQSNEMKNIIKKDTNEDYYKHIENAYLFFLIKHLKKVLGKHNIKSDLTVCWNPNCGASVHFLKKIIDILNNAGYGKHFLINDDIKKKYDILPDGPDPICEKNIEKVLEIKADIVFSFDGDGDRLHVIYNKKAFASQLIGCILAIKLNIRKVVHDIHMSQVYINFLRSKNIKTISSKVGHSYVQEKMRKNNAELGIEMSGHFFWKECFGADDALLTAMKVLGLFLTDQFEMLNVDVYQSSVQRIKLKDRSENIQTCMNKLKLLVNKNNKISRIDGIKIFYPEGWILVRGSNTQPVLSVMYEVYVSKDDQIIEEKLQLILQAIL